MDKSLVFDIVRDHFQKNDNQERFKNYISHFKYYFDENCSIKYLNIMIKYEKTGDGLFEILRYLSEHLLKKYGYVEYEYKGSNWSESRIWKYHPQLDSLLLP